MTWHPTPFELRASGRFACFTNPAFTGERFSYDVPTPVALRGLVDAILYRRGARWVIDQIRILAPIQRTNLPRIELESFGALPIDASTRSIRRQTSLLVDVDYGLTCHVECSDPGNVDTDFLSKLEAMFARYLRRGQSEHFPHFGCREFGADVRLAGSDDPQPIQDSRALGRMVYDYVWENGVRSEILEYSPQLENGVIRVPSYQDVLWVHHQDRAHLGVSA
jgi:CRISPR-associated protein Cas5d